ncbi:ornithine cyclodeaminase family protein [Luteithermobacter gelatinilyticus]|uniref:ornithine cyclodeaminase family protein n=1 Tax=Luteithermobacter gelatinilyticus TaxID=2582913 RepID=UPI001105EDF9|nr:ornithine cyclodeaminase family protein [Luteithermobacter gelatinilyticus]
MSFPMNFPMSFSRPPFVTAAEIAEALPYDRLVPELEKAFAIKTHIPERAHYQMGTDWGRDAQMLIMPAWRADGFFGVKLISLYPDNPKAGLPNITGVYCLFDGDSGQLLAMMDAGEITRRRTAAASVLAARYLAPENARTLLIIGTGALARPFIEAYSSWFDLDNILIWGRSEEKAQKVVSDLQDRVKGLSMVKDLEKAAARAQIITTLTTSRSPLLHGDWVPKGTHLDLVGSYRPDMREVDDRAILKSTLFTDIMDGAPREAGDLVIPLKEKLISLQDIQADLHALVTKQHPGRTSPEEITLFKAAGAALEDLAAAVLVHRSRQ